MVDHPSSHEQAKLLEMELSALPFGIPDTHTSTTLLALRNAAATRAFDALFNAHRELREYRNQIDTRKELEELLKKRGLSVIEDPDKMLEGVYVQGPAKKRDRALSNA